MNWRVMRNLLVVFGAYSLAAWFASLISASEAALGIEFGGTGRLGEVWMYGRMNAGRGVAAGGATALVWFTLGAPAARRWWWALPAFFAAFGLAGMRRYWAPGVTPDPISFAVDVAAFCLMPALGCIAALWLLHRFVPTSGDETFVNDPPEGPTNARARALLVAWSIMMLMVGAFIGMLITGAADFRGMTGAMAAMFELRSRSQYALSQYREASFVEAKEALERHAAYLEGLAPASPTRQGGDVPWLDEKGLAFERMLTYGRLALRAERAGLSNQAGAYWQRAEQNARTLDWEDPSRDRIRETMTRLDTERPGSGQRRPDQ